MSMSPPRDPATLAVHAGNAPDTASGGVAPPIQLSTTFIHGAAGERPDGPEGGHQYQRESNPTQTRLEAALAALEGGAEARVFATGMAAIHAALSSAGRDARVLVPRQCYAGTRALATGFLPELGIRADFVDMTDLDAIERALGPDVRLVWIETPSNPTLEITDIAAVAARAHAAGARVACDNTFATPALTRPLAHGADLVMHSTTKYLSGHSDTMGGALVFRESGAWCDSIDHRRHLTGATLAPFNAWLTLRGLRTLYPRMAWHCRSAEAIASALSGHPAIKRVLYPGLAAHPGHAIANRQMRKSGGMLSVLLKGGRDAALALCERVTLFTVATSLGGVESLIEHRASVEGPDPTSPENLVRLSIGLEHPDDLIGDLTQALDRCG